MINISQALVNNSVSIIILVVILGVVCAFLLAVYIANSITKPIIKLKNSIKNINEKNLNQQIEINSQDEIGELSNVFNNMLQKIHISQENIELQIAERTAELNKLNKYMVGRELKMIELKKALEQKSHEN